MDGETDWKLRKAIRKTQQFFSENKETNVFYNNFQLIIQKPSEQIYKFEGTFELEDGCQEGLNLEHTLWANTVLANGKIYG